MANGRLTLGKQSGGVLSLTFPDGVTNTEVVLPENGDVAIKTDINTSTVLLKTIAAGTATFTATTNNINLTGIGVGVEIGDVIQISGAEDAKNNSEFTVEVIIDDNNIIVNQAHANKGTTKNVAARVSDTDVIVKLVAKGYNAHIGLGRADIVFPLSVNTTRQNLTGRPILVSIYPGDGEGVIIFQNITMGTNYIATITTGAISSITALIGVNEIYKWVINSGAPTNIIVKEVR